MKMMKRLISQPDTKRPPAEHDDVAGFVVTERKSGQMVHHESIDSGRYSSTRLADMMMAKRSRLERKYAPSRYDVEAGIFNNRKSFEHFFPTVGRK